MKIQTIRKPGPFLKAAFLFIALAAVRQWTIPLNTARGADCRIPGFQNSAADQSNDEFTNSEILAPRIVLSRDSLYFGATTFGAKTNDQEVIVSNGSAGTLAWTATPSDSWISVAPRNASGNGILTVGVKPAGLEVGAHYGTVYIADPSAFDTPQTIAVILDIGKSVSAPFGAFESPKNKARVRGMVPLSGWALDDVEVIKIEIRRDADKSDPPGSIGSDGLVHVGDAAFIEGAKPNIEIAYPGFPFNQRAGWGVMLMTCDLPNGGQGTFTLYAIATDGDNNRTEIGKKIILGRNRFSKKPFGTIDAPAWGEMISASSYFNTGWMLTPRPKIIRTDGSTIGVWIDGVKRGHPVYNQYREDIALRFADLKNSAGAGASWAFDASGYAEGLHTITWVARDSSGAAGDTGTNYFAIGDMAQGAAQNRAAALSFGVRKTQGIRYRRISELSLLPLNAKWPMFSRGGFLPGKAFQSRFPDACGVINVDMEEMNLVEIHLYNAEMPPPEDGKLSGTASGLFEGYLIVGDGLKPLPVGSTLDEDRGVFSWQPGPGFLGQYDFIFIKRDPDGFSEKRRLTITIRLSSEAEE